jgi:hypothetical protein
MVSEQVRYQLCATKSTQHIAFQSCIEDEGRARSRNILMYVFFVQTKGNLQRNISTNILRCEPKVIRPEGKMGGKRVLSYPQWKPGS